MFNFRAFARDHSVPLIESGHHHTHQGWIQTHCPFCASGLHGWHLGFSLERGTFHCWRCGGHSVWDVLRAILRTSRKDLIAQALEKYGDGARVKPKAPKARRKTLTPIPGVGPLKPQHERYLCQRKFDPAALVKEWGLMGTSHLSGAWNWRVVFPIHNREGHPVAFCGRAIQKEVKPKYKMMDDDDILMDPRALLYGIEKVEKHVLVVEGPADAWRMGPGAVATLGIDWKLEQALLLRDVPNRFIMFDPEPQAQRRARQLAEWLGVFPGVTEVITDLTSDPGDLPQAEAMSIRKTLGFPLP